MDCDSKLIKSFLEYALESILVLCSQSGIGYKKILDVKSDTKGKDLEFYQNLHKKSKKKIEPILYQYTGHSELKTNLPLATTIRTDTFSTIISQDAMVDIHLKPLLKAYFPSLNIQTYNIMTRKVGGHIQISVASLYSFIIGKDSKQKFYKDTKSFFQIRVLKYPLTIFTVSLDNVYFVNRKTDEIILASYNDVHKYWADPEYKELPSRRGRHRAIVLVENDTLRNQVSVYNYDSNMTDNINSKLITSIVYNQVREAVGRKKEVNMYIGSLKHYGIQTYASRYGNGWCVMYSMLMIFTILFVITGMKQVGIYIPIHIWGKCIELMYTKKYKRYQVALLVIAFTVKVYGQSVMMQNLERSEEVSPKDEVVEEDAKGNVEDDVEDDAEDEAEDEKFITPIKKRAPQSPKLVPVKKIKTVVSAEQRKRDLQMLEKKSKPLPPKSSPKKSKPLPPRSPDIDLLGGWDDDDLEYHKPKTKQVQQVKRKTFRKK